MTANGSKDRDFQPVSWDEIASGDESGSSLSMMVLMMVAHWFRECEVALSLARGCWRALAGVLAAGGLYW